MDHYYWVRILDGSEKIKRVLGIPVKIKGFEQFEFFAHHFNEGGGWWLSERKTGARLTSESADTIEAALHILEARIFMLTPSDIEEAIKIFNKGKEPCPPVELETHIPRDQIRVIRFKKGLGFHYE